MNTIFRWEGKGRYGSFDQWINARVCSAGRTVRSLDNALPYLSALEVACNKALYKCTELYIFTFIAVNKYVVFINAAD